MPTLNDVLAGSQAQAVQVQQIIDALKGTPNKGVPVALVSLNDPNNYALTAQNDDPVNSRALSVLKADGTTLISADATGVTLGAPLNVPAGALNGTQLANASVSNAKLGPDVARANLLTNGGFEIWQRGNGPNSGSGAFVAGDRWASTLAGTDTISVSRDTANADASTGSLTCAACTFTLGNGAGASAIFQKIPSADGYQIGNRQLSLSMRVRTATANAVRIGLFNGSAWTQSAFHMGDGTYQTLTVTATMGSTGAWQCGVFFGASCVGYLDNAMLVIGSQPCDYVALHPADDLARCLRYFEVLGQNAAIVAPGMATAATAAQHYLRYSSKAVTPTINISAAAHFAVLAATGSPQACTALTASGVTNYSCLLSSTIGASTLVAGNSSALYGNNASAVLSIEANP